MLYNRFWTGHFGSYYLPQQVAWDNSGDERGDISDIKSVSGFDGGFNDESNNEFDALLSIVV